MNCRKFWSGDKFLGHQEARSLCTASVYLLRKLRRESGHKSGWEGSSHLPDLVSCPSERQAIVGSTLG